MDAYAIINNYEDQGVRQVLRSLDYAAGQRRRALVEVQRDSTDALDRIARGMRAGTGTGFTVLHAQRVFEVETMNAQVEALIQAALAAGVTEDHIIELSKGAA